MGANWGHSAARPLRACFRRRCTCKPASAAVGAFRRLMGPMPSNSNRAPLASQDLCEVLLTVTSWCSLTAPNSIRWRAQRLEGQPGQTECLASPLLSSATFQFVLVITRDDNSCQHPVGTRLGLSNIQVFYWSLLKYFIMK